MRMRMKNKNAFTAAKRGMKAFYVSAQKRIGRTGLILLFAEKCPYAGPTSAVKSIS